MARWLLTAGCCVVASACFYSACSAAGDRTAASSGEGGAGRYQYTRVDLVRHNFQPQGGCNNGRHDISSKQPFGLTVWGWGSAETGNLGAGFYTQYVSYAYPAGAGVAPINTVEVPAVPE